MPDRIQKQVVSVIDDRTTVVCLHAAGQIRPVDEPFETLAGNIDEPPFHVHCRSMVVPWIPGFVNSLRKQANTELMARPLKQRRIGPGGQIGGRVPPRSRIQPPTVPDPSPPPASASLLAKIQALLRPDREDS